MRQYDVYGLGNALVDIEYHVDVEDLAALGIQKGVMTLVDEQRQSAIVDRLGSQEANRGSGGSAANTIIAVSQLGGRAFYSCRVADDAMGRFYIDDLTGAGVRTNVGAADLPRGVTGKCLVLVTQDADRTMNTFLGVSADVSPADVDREAIRESQYVYLEGYLVTGGERHVGREVRSAAGSIVQHSCGDVPVGSEHCQLLPVVRGGITSRRRGLVVCQ